MSKTCGFCSEPCGNQHCVTNEDNMSKEMNNKIIEILEKYEDDLEVHDFYDPIIGVPQSCYPSIATEIVEVVKEHVYNKNKQLEVENE